MPVGGEGRAAQEGARRKGARGSGERRTRDGEAGGGGPGPSGPGTRGPTPDGLEPPAPPSPAGGPTSGPSPDGGDGPVLSEGDRGPEVSELQRRLRQLDWAYNGGLHGRYDDETRLAVARFQLANGVTGDPEGVYGAATRDLLESMTIEP